MTWIDSKLRLRIKTGLPVIDNLNTLLPSTSATLVRKNLVLASKLLSIVGVFIVGVRGRWHRLQQIVWLVKLFAFA